MLAFLLVLLYSNYVNGLAVGSVDYCDVPLDDNGNGRYSGTYALECGGYTYNIEYCKTVCKDGYEKKEVFCKDGELVNVDGHVSVPSEYYVMEYCDTKDIFAVDGEGGMYAQYGVCYPYEESLVSKDYDVLFKKLIELIFTKLNINKVLFVQVMRFLVQKSMN